MMVGFDDGTVEPFYAVIHESKLWLVTEWLIDRATGVATPERMIRVDSFQEILDGPCDYADRKSVV